jgi:hypothetical protein
MMSLIGMTLREAFELGVSNIGDQAAEILTAALRRDELTATANEYSEEHIDANGAHHLQRKPEARLEPRFWDLAKPNWFDNHATRQAYPGEGLPAAMATGIWVRRRDIEAFGWKAPIDASAAHAPPERQAKTPADNREFPLRRKGNPGNKTDRIAAQMRELDSTALANLTLKEMAAKFDAANSTCAKARKMALSGNVDK